MCLHTPSLFSHWTSSLSPEQISKKTRSDSAGSPQVSSYRRETLKPASPHSANPPTFLLLHPLKSRSNWFGLRVNCVSSLFFSPLSFILPSSLPSLFSLSGEARRTGTSMYKHGGEKTKTLQHTDVASVLFFFFIVFFIPFIVAGCIETGDVTKTCNIHINKLKPTEL